MGNFTPYGGLYHMRRRRRMANIVLQQLTPWSSGLDVTAGDYVSSESGNSPWLATSSGTTGDRPPYGQGAFSDGGVDWVRADIMSLLQFLYTGVPSPTVNSGGDGISAPANFTLVAASVASGGGYGYESVQDSYTDGTISQQPMTNYYLTAFFTQNGDDFVISFVGNCLSIMQNYTPVVNGTPITGGTWSYNSGYTQYFLAYGGGPDPFDFNDDQTYDITWQEG